MKKKNWISLIALMIIVSISLIGQQFCEKGEWGTALIALCIYLFPCVLFFLIAVLTRKRKGSHVQFFRWLSYGSFALYFLFLLFLSTPFMHFFNVLGKQDKVKEQVLVIVSDCNTMFSEYTNMVGARVSNYRSVLNACIHQQNYAVLKNIWSTVSNFDSKFVNQVVDVDWKEKKMFRNHYPNEEKWKKQRIEFEDALVNNFDVWTASGQLNQLIIQYDEYKKTLSDDFQSMTPFEKQEGFNPEFIFANSEVEWRKSMEIFTKPAFSGGYFLIYLILAILASSSYIFFKDSTVKKTKRSKGKQGVYQLGHKL